MTGGANRSRAKSRHIRQRAAAHRTLLYWRGVTPELDREIHARVAAATAAWPGVRVAADRVVRAIVAQLADAELAELHVDDLYLACACAEGDAAALAAFEARHGAAIERAIAAAGAPASERADLGQIVRQRVLVEPGDGKPPRIASYSARGSLAAWVRVVATREAARLLAREPREVGAADDELARLIAPEDPELDYFKRLYAGEFKRAFQTAVEALDGRDRLVLRQHTLDGLGIDQLAALHRVHRATAARWIEAAREAVVARTLRELTRKLQLSRAELASVIRLIRSQLDVSLPRLLAE